MITIHTMTFSGEGLTTTSGSAGTDEFRKVVSDFQQSVKVIDEERFVLTARYIFKFFRESFTRFADATADSYC